MGIKFETFTTLNGLPDNEVFFFTEDRQNRLWLGTYNGKLCFYKDGIFHTAENTSYLRSSFKPTNFTSNIIVQPDSSVIITHNKNFIQIKDTVMKVFDLHSALAKEGPGTIQWLRKLNENRYDAVLIHKIITFDSNNKVLSVVNQENDVVISQVQNQVFAFHNNIKYNNKIWHEGDSLTFSTKNCCSQHNITAIYNDGQQIFMLTHEGLYLYDSIRVLKDKHFSGISQDNKENYWLSTTNDGIYIYNKDFLRTRVYRKAYDRHIKYIKAFDNFIAFCTDHSLYKLSNHKTQKYFDYDWLLKNNPNSMETGFYIDKSFKFYSFFNHDALLIDNISAVSPRPTRIPLADSFAGNFKKMLLKADRMYFQKSNPIGYIHVLPSPTKQQLIVNYFVSGAGDRVYSIAQDNNDSIWYSNLKGVFKISGDKMQIQTQFGPVLFKYMDFFAEFLVGYDHTNQLVVCHPDGAHIKIDSITSQNCVWDKFYQLDSRHVLISTNSLYRIMTLPSKENENCTVSAIEDPFLPLHANAICTDRENCYFFKEGDITSLPLKTILAEPFPPKLFFTGLKLRGKNYPITPKMKIAYSDAKNIKISFSTLSYGGKDIVYKYSVSKNKIDNWRDQENEDITLINPTYGRYIVKIKGRSLSGAYSTPIVFVFYILPPFWARAWFICLMVVVVSTIATLAIRYRIKVVLRRREKVHSAEIKFMRSEYKALNALMNPHFIFNTLNNVQSLFNDNKRLAANQYLRIFADLIRQNMQNVSKEMIPLQKEIDLVENYLRLEKLRFEEKLSFDINVDENIDLTTILIPPLLIQPLVENSIKHGIFPSTSNNGFVQINISEIAGIVKVEVKDNGVGFTKSQNAKYELHQSYGMENIERRMAQLSIIQNKRYTFQISEIIDSTGQNWTIAAITIPI